MNEQDTVQAILNWLEMRAVACEYWAREQERHVGVEIDAAKTRVEGAAYRQVQREIAEGQWQRGIPAVHWLREGRTRCGLPGFPKDWPEGHKWSEEESDVTCEACKRNRP